MNVFSRFNCIQELLVGLAYRFIKDIVPKVLNPMIFYTGVCFANFGLGMGVFQKIPTLLAAATEHLHDGEISSWRRYKSPILALSFYVGHLFYASRIWSHPPLEKTGEFGNLLAAVLSAANDLCDDQRKEKFSFRALSPRLGSAGPLAIHTIYPLCPSDWCSVRALRCYGIGGNVREKFKYHGTKLCLM